jgi:hypothetical protein
MDEKKEFPCPECGEIVKFKPDEDDQLVVPLNFRKTLVSGTKRTVQILIG